MWRVMQFPSIFLMISQPAIQLLLGCCRPQKAAPLFAIAIAFFMSGGSHAGIINGDFEANGYSNSPIGWTASGIFTTAHVSVEKPGYIAEVSNGTFFADFNVEGPRVLTGNVLSQTAVADGDHFAFSWSRLRNSYLGNGGPTLQVAYQDITAGGPLTFENIDSAPNGDEPLGSPYQPWRQVSIPGFTTGHTYFVEFRAGPSQGVTLSPSHDVYYMIDNVAFSGVPEPSAIVLLSTGATGLFFVAWRRRYHRRTP